MSIEKLEYKRRFFDVTTMRDGARITTVIEKDGTIVSKEYGAASRKIDTVHRTTCSSQEFNELCSEIELCIENADRLDYYVDDSSEELTIFYKYGRIQKMDRGLGNDDTHIGQIVNAFLEKHLSEK